MKKYAQAVAIFNENRKRIELQTKLSRQRMSSVMPYNTFSKTIYRPSTSLANASLAHRRTSNSEMARDISIISSPIMELSEGTIKENKNGSNNLAINILQSSDK